MSYMKVSRRRIRQDNADCFSTYCFGPEGSALAMQDSIFLATDASHIGVSERRQGNKGVLYMSRQDTRRQWQDRQDTQDVEPQS